MRDGKTFLLVLTAVLLSVSGPALAKWQGQNGVVRFSFTEGSELQPVAHVPVGENGVTQVDLYAWLTDVVPLEKDDEAYVGTSGFELQLVIEGAEAFITKQEYPLPVRQVGKQLGNCIVGLDPALTFEDGRTQLVHWQIMFQGEVEDVVFRLDPEGLISCQRDPECDGSGVSMLYTGSRYSKLMEYVFGAGYQPAYLNPTGEPDLSAVNGNVSWEDVGGFERR